MLVGQLEYTLGEGRGKQHVEPLIGRWQPPHDVADVGDEAQVEHPVRLVEHQRLHRAQVVDMLLVEIDQPSGRPDQDIDARLELPALFFIIDAAKREPEGQPRVLPENLRVAVDLHRELARRRDDQRPRRVAAARRRHLAAQQRGVHRDEECRGLTGARLRLAGHVHAGERPRQGLRLDWSAALESSVGDAARERVG